MDQWAREIIMKIADRGAALALTHGVRNVRAFDVLFAVTLVHDKLPLRLQELAEADDANFGHDVFGILRHIDSDTGELRGFCPRFVAG